MRKKRKLIAQLSFSDAAMSCFHMNRDAPRVKALYREQPWLKTLISDTQVGRKALA
ncbi:hypothetical protein MUK42_15414 [Musa troglodytarum]|uniref:Uncharacterized protein n=1 Tax=Musa troglodytarum TaxID=320322 RepID=A0A9E7IED2_9LILI|nr:hypothetical protein MUK42_15414 [Musa troglodytarum]